MDILTFISMVIITLFLLYHVGKWTLKGISWILLKTVYRPVLRKHEAERQKSIEWLKSIGIKLVSNEDPNHFKGIR